MFLLFSEPLHSQFSPSGRSGEGYHAAAGTTVLLGEGVVGRCAQQRCVQVFRQGKVSDGMHTQSRIYCSMNIPVPEHSFNISGAFVNPN